MAFKPYCDRCKTWHSELEGHRETAICTLCAGVESPGFYTGCMVKDGHVTDWQCDGNGNLSRPVRDCEVCGGDCAAANPPVMNCPKDLK